MKKVRICHWINTCENFKKRSYIYCGKDSKRYSESDCMLLLCHLRVSEWIYTLQLPECQGSLCSKQAMSEIYVAAVGLEPTTT